MESASYSTSFEGQTISSQVDFQKLSGDIFDSSAPGEGEELMTSEQEKHLDENLRRRLLKWRGNENPKKED